ncbi:phage holin [Hazenella coriacea]|uniref:Putative membrane protein n=1 Tax=Hazenella coriacea TaxID=1179467 RepID=A0A4R3LER0_9BACL|nr:phage holin [Hazenella coriacea]TCS96834.1 putative membrane protein [Hazenella coriacea]
MDWFNRFRNYGFWVSFSAYVFILLQALGFEIIEQQYLQIVNAGLGILVLLGIVNNPTTDNKGFFDDDEGF